jgi:hypothetical protein
VAIRSAAGAKWADEVRTARKKFEDAMDDYYNRFIKANKAPKPTKADAEALRKQYVRYAKAAERIVADFKEMSKAVKGLGASGNDFGDIIDYERLVKTIEQQAAKASKN